jgi:ubiquinone/menaquinone biosynthesis C-methylase UbiE
MDSKQANQSSYVIDSSMGAEIARLTDQDAMLTQATGILPTQIDLTETYHLLDVACGPGGWARAVARQLPDIEIVGVDINRDMVGYANAFAKVEQLHNLSFQVMDVRQALAFADASFDLVNARLLTAAVNKHVWPALVKEYARITRPGGWIVLTESDKFFITNSEAGDALVEMGLKAMLRTGFYGGIWGDGITPHLASFCTNAGLTDIQSEQHLIDFSSGTPAYPALVSNVKIAWLLMQPFILKMGYSTQEELTVWYEKAIQDVERDDFRGHVDLTRVWGRKQ